MALARVDVEAVRLLLPRLDVNEEFPRLSAHRELGDATRVGADEPDRAMVARLGARQGAAERDAVDAVERGAAKSSSVGVKSTRLAGSAITVPGSTPGPETISGTSMTSSNSVAPCMWYVPCTACLSARRSPHDSPWSE